MREVFTMAERETKRRGGFMAFLAMIVAIIALVFSLLAYERAGRTAEEDIAALKARIVELKKGEDELRKKLAATLEKVAEKIGQKEEAAEEQ
jgi:vacuolar-type H+-ATPase subunit I/STV1